MKHYIFYILAIFAAVSCTQKVTDSEIFNGEIKIIDDTVKSIVEMQGKEIILDGITYGIPAVYDSLLFFHIDNLPDAFYIVFNLKTGKELGYFCPKGQGPGEVRYIFPINHLYRENGYLKAFLASPYNFIYVEWNISKSIETGKTVWDFIPYDWRKKHDSEFPYSHIMRLNDKKFVGRVQPLCLNPDEFCTLSTAPSFEKCDIYDDTLIKKYPIYKKTLKREDSNRLFSAFPCVSPDGNKIVQFMTYLWQINTINIETGEIVGYRKRNTPDYLYLNNFMESSQKRPLYFIGDAVSNDKYIFVTNMNGKTIEEYNDDYIVHVFDWKCNVVKKLKISKERKFGCIFLDKVNNLLYTFSWVTEKIFCYDLNSVGL
ncbi:MAG: hypothetical protein LBD59_02865 [Prevotellaceae bacterium]|jgi:hypothetical protein|nr:hypothetical protein [Prevotellaceae bacterium]